MSKILIVDDQADIIATLRERLELEGYTVDSAKDAEATYRKLEEFTPALVILDVYLQQDETGIDILKKIRASHSGEELPVIILTGQPDSELCIAAHQAGANDFSVKPVNYGKLLAAIRDQLQATQKEQPQMPAWEEKIIGTSDKMIELTQQIIRTAAAEIDTLILGETGTGKDLVARTIHRLSSRKHKPFQIIDCTTISPHLFENELFGHMPGSYTQAKDLHKGKIEVAAGGMVFLNEIGDMPLEQQSKLLAFRENKTITRLGDTQAIKMDVVILAATNRDLLKMVEQGVFREDLYYRLQGNIILVPPPCASICRICRICVITFCTCLISSFIARLRRLSLKPWQCCKNLIGEETCGICNNA